MMTRDPLISFNIDVLLEWGRTSSALKIAKKYRIRTQERLDKTRLIIEAARKTLRSSEALPRQKDGDE